MTLGHAASRVRRFSFDLQVSHQSPSHPRSYMSPGFTPDASSLGRCAGWGPAATPMGVRPSMGAASLYKSMDAASLHNSMGAASLHKSMGAASLYKSMGAASLHKSMGGCCVTPKLSCVVFLLVARLLETRQVELDLQQTLTLGGKHRVTHPVHAAHDAPGVMHCVDSARDAPGVMHPVEAPGVTHHVTHPV